MGIRLALIRHGETVENLAGRGRGGGDAPLPGNGRRQAVAVAGRLKGRGPHAAIYGSPLARALETARLVAAVLGPLAVQVDPGLSEYDFGEWDGLTPAELRERGFWQAVRQDARFAPPGGEPFVEAARRVVAALSAIARAHVGGSVVVVGHGLSLAAGLALLLRGDPTEAARYALDNGGMAELSIAATPRLLAIDFAAACELA